MFMIDLCNVSSEWTVLNDATENLTDTVTDSKNRTCLGVTALQFDKVNGTGHVAAGVYKTLTWGDQKSPALSNGLSTGFHPFDQICWHTWYSSETDIVSSFVRIGSSAVNYYEWQYLVASTEANIWNLNHVKLCAPSMNAASSYVGFGTGLNWNDIKYLAIGFNFSAEEKTLADLAVSGIYIERADVLAVSL